MKVSVWVAPVASVIILLGSVGVATVTGDWVTSGRQQVVQGQETSSGDVKGWMTLEGVAQGAGIGLDELIKEAGLPADIATRVPLKDLKETLPDFEISQVRDAVERLS